MQPSKVIESNYLFSFAQVVLLWLPIYVQLFWMLCCCSGLPVVMSSLIFSQLYTQVLYLVDFQ